LKLEAREDELKARLSHAPVDIPDIHPNIAGIYQRKVERLAEALRRPQERDEAAEANPVPSSSASIAATLHGPRYDPRMGGPKTEHSPGAFASGVSA